VHLIEMDDGMYEKAGLQTKDFLHTFCNVFGVEPKSYLAHDEIEKAILMYQEHYDDRSNEALCKDHQLENGA
jgi:hypothetical protein